MTLNERSDMTRVVTEACVKCTACVSVCPVSCFYEGPNMLVIDPDACIDCGLCVTECPSDAIVSDDTEKGETWLSVNKKFSKVWPNIT